MEEGAYRYWSMQSQSLGSFSKWNQPGSLSTGRMVPRRWPSKHLRASLNVHLDHDCPWRCWVSRVSPVTHDRGIGQTNIEFDSIRFHLVRIHLVQRFVRKINVDSIGFREIFHKEKNNWKGKYSCKYNFFSSYRIKYLWSYENENLSAWWEIWYFRILIN